MASVNIHSGTSDSYNWNDSSANTVVGRTIVETLAGIPYAVMRNVTTAGSIEVWKGNASTPTSWSQQDSANNPSASTYNVPACAIDSTGVIHIVYFDVNGKNSALRYVTFNTSTDTFSGDSSIYDVGSATVTWAGVGIAIDLNDVPHVVFTDVNSNMGSDYDTVYYGNRTGGSWNTSVEVEGQANQKNCRLPSICITHENYPSIAYINVTDTTITHATATSNNPSSFTPTDRDTTVSTTAGSQSTSIIQRGTTTWFAYVDSDDSIVVYEGATQRDTGRTGKTPQITLDASGNITVFYIDVSSGTGNVTYSTWNGSTWDTEVDAETGSYSTPKTLGAFRTVEGYDTGGSQLRNDGTAGSYTYCGQSFTGNGGWIHGVRVRMRDGVGAATGTFIARLFAHTGTYGTSSQWTGTALASSTTVDASFLFTALADVHFRFATPYQTTNGTKYVIRIDGNSVSGETYIEAHASSPTHGGNLSRTNYLGDPAVTQSSDSTRDLRFALIGTGGRVMYGFDAGADLYWNELGTAGAYTLAISAGSYAVTGQAVGLLADRTLTVSAGTYAVTGQDVTLSHGYVLTVSAGTYTTVGQDVSLLADRTLTVSAGTYTVVGQDVSLIKGYTLTVDAGSYAVTGQDVGLTKQWMLVPEAGSYAVTGQDVTLLADRTLTIDAGSYAVTGQDVGLLKGYVLIPSAGTYTTTGQDVSLLVDRTLTVSAGTYSVVGQDVSLTKGFTMVVEAGSYAVTGQDVNLLVDRIITLDAGSYAVTGQDVALTKGFTMFVSAGTYTTVGQDVTLLLDRVLSISAGTYTTTGQDVNLLADRVLALDSGTYSVNGQDVTLLKAHLLTIETGNYTYSGQDVTLIYTPGSGSTQKRIILIS